MTGVPQDDLSFPELLKLAEQGNADAQFRIGRVYSSGGNVPQDYAKAVQWFRIAADQGHSGAQFHLGFMLAKVKARL